MRILFVGPPLYGLLYPVLSLAQAFRVNGHEVLIASGGQFAQKAAEAGLVVFDAAPGLDSEAGYRHHEAQRNPNGQLLILQRRNGRPSGGVCRTLAA